MSEPGLYNVFDMLLDRDESGWIKMLVFAVLIGASAVSSFVRQRNQKRKLEREENPPPRPAQSAKRQEVKPLRPAIGPPRERESADRPKPRTILRPGGVLSTFVAEIKKEIKRAADEAKGVKAPPARAIVQPKPPEPAKVARAMPKLDEPKSFIEGIPLESEIEEFSEIAPEFAGPDDLKKAVLYYEILGKPISMRGQADRIMGL